MRNRWRKSHGIVGLFLVLSLASCGVKQRPLLEDLHHREDFGLMRLASARGLRDGDRLAAQLLITDSSTMLTMDLHFLVTPPTRLDTSAWKSSQGGSGTVEARSITFLGGQSEPPSLGGTFDLIDSQGQALYRVHLPTTPLQK